MTHVMKIAFNKQLVLVP